MSAPDFLDTNILVYAYDAGSPHKQKLAQDLVRKALLGEAITSAQALGEFAATMLHKLTPKLRLEDVLSLLDALGPIAIVTTDGDTVRRAVEAHAKYGIHFYDGMIVASAERAGCKRILSEDFSSGQKYFGVVVENPFV
jgi:predicted nucleic acid-binding protein